jgi:hypothetical protein
MVNRKLIGNMKKYMGWRRRRLFGLIGTAFYLHIPTLPEKLTVSDKGNQQAPEADASFPGCTVKEQNCTDTECSFYSACDGEQKQCTVYDCGDEYGLYIRTADGTVKTKREKKPDLSAIEKERQDCSGSMELLQQGCSGQKFQAKVKLTTKGQCEIDSFIVTLDNLGNVFSTIKSEGDGIYSISSDRCGKAVRISPVTKSGISLEF